MPEVLFNLPWLKHLDLTGNEFSDEYKSTVKIPPHLLNVGGYYLSVSIDTASPKKYCYHNLPDILHFRVDDKLDDRSITKGNFRINRDDIVFWAAFDWDFEKLK